MSDRIVDRVMAGQTPLQVVAQQGGLPKTRLPSIVRFPYYTSFPFGWYRAAFSEDLASGGVLPVHFLNRELVVWRSEEGDAHVMDAHCPHLGAHLGVSGRVEGRHLVCPFHWWEFDGSGENVRVPYAKERNRSAKIGTYPTRDVNGLVLFWYHPQGEPPSFQVPEIASCTEAGWTDVRRFTWQVRAPWQELAENGPDFVHLRTVHGAADVPELESYELDGPCQRLRARVNFETPRGPQAGRIDTDGWGPGFSVARFEGIIDAQFVAASTPVDFETTEVTHSYRIRWLGDGPEDHARTERVGEALIRDLVKQEEEDIVIFDHKIYQPRPRLSPADGPIGRFRDWAEQFYLPGDPRGTNSPG